MSIKDALARKDVVVEIGGYSFTLRRPSVADIIEATEQSAKEPKHFVAWLVMNHLIEDGKPLFTSIQEVLDSDGNMVEALAAEIDRLYGEGRD
jgi:hypothetical protein